MTDVFSKKTRSRIMSSIRGRDTTPELLLRKKLSTLGYRYRTNRKFKYAERPFKPDLVFAKWKLCIFVDGCFWHKCPKCYRPPKSNKSYWIPKIKGNVLRDKDQNDYLRKDGWKVMRIWEHEINKNPDRTTKKIVKRLKQ